MKRRVRLRWARAFRLLAKIRNQQRRKLKKLTKPKTNQYGK